MMRQPASLLVITSLLLTGCGGGGGGSSSGTVTLPGATPTPTPTAGCGLADRQAFALSTLREWYLFPETLPATLNSAPYATVQDYLDALTATARSQNRDRYFTYITSIAEENAFFSSGQSAGFGVRLSADAGQRRAFIAEAFEGAPALAAGIDRGDEILAIGTTSANLRLVSDIIAAEGTGGVSAALGPSTAGTTRVLRLANGAGTRELSVTKASYDLTPVSSRYGARTLTADGKRIGYLNLRTFISSADPQLRTAFANFRAEGITEFIIDFRYNGGGLVSTAELMGDLLGGNRTASQVYSRTSFRPEKSSNNEVRNFNPGAQSVSPVKIAFIGTGSTASASELVINSMASYLGNNLALVGSNTYGKPVGQVAIDKSACDDRIRVVAFATASANGTNNYYNGLATTLANTCAAPDDLTRPLGDVAEASIARAVDFLAGRSCAPITAGAGKSLAAPAASAPALLTPEQPTVPQREVPGLF